MASQMRRATHNLVILSILALILVGVLVVRELIDSFGSSSTPVEPPPSHVGYPEAPAELSTIKEDSAEPLKQETIARVAVVIDDFGYQWPQDHVQGFINSKYPVTLAIIPGAWASKRTAKAANENGHEIIVHVPMEPDHPDDHTEEKMLNWEMSGNEVFEYLDWAFASVPYALGLNNHMGSYVTTYAPTMRYVAAYCSQNDKWVLDSITHPKTLLYAKAVDRGVKAVKRSIFLDHEDDPEYIRGQLMSAVEKSKRYGKVIVVIGHPRRTTWSVLSKEMPILAENGVEWVYLSEALENVQQP